MRALIVAVLLSAVAPPSGTDEIQLLEQTTDTGTVEYRVSRSKLEGMREWRPLQDDPSLSPRRAAQIAASHLRPRNPERVAVIGVNINGVGTNRGLRCFYVVTAYDLDAAYGDSPPDTREVVILMDGAIVRASPVVGPTR
jgi:hypothetical protein